MPEELVVRRGEDVKTGEDMQVALDARLEGIFGKRAGDVGEQLAGPKNFWDVYAIGPYQVPNLEPSRLIEVGEQATIIVVVYLNPFVPNPAPGMNACDIIAGFGASIELNFYTSNIQTMTPVPALSHQYCICTVPGQCWYSYYWTFTPQQAACLYETNICVRICNCYNYYVRQYSGFARWIENLDFDLLGGAPSWQFDHPIRYMVSDHNDRCDCPRCP